MKVLLGKIYGIYAGIVFFLVAIVMVIAFLIIKALPIRDRKKMFSVYTVTNVMLAIWQFFTLSRMKMEGAEKIDPDKVYVFTPNHVNMLDITMFGRFFHFYARPLAKKEITKLPIFGQLFSLTSILVDRDDKNSRKDSIATMQEAMKKGMSVIIFPEGTRNKTEVPLRPFHTGAFRLAVAEQVPIVPIVQLNLRNMQPVGTIEYYPGKMIMRYLDPIPTIGLTAADVPMLSEKVKQAITEELLKEDKYWSKQPVVRNAVAAESKIEE